MTSTTRPETLRVEVVRLLAENGYVVVPSRLKIGDVELEIQDLWESPPESMDLSLVSDRPDSRESTLRLYWLVQRLTRALDAAASRRTVSVVLIGQPSSNTGISELLELARVLIVDGSLATERMIGPLLKLQLPATSTAAVVGMSEVVKSLGKNQSAPSNILRLINAASDGSNAVTDRYRAWLD